MIFMATNMCYKTMGEKIVIGIPAIPCVAKFVKSIELQPSERLNVKHNGNKK
jgi:hypothetical protein